MQDINRLLGIKIRTIRNERKISQEELGFLSDLHRTYIGQIERAEKNITLKKLDQIAKALGITVSELTDFKKINDI